MIGSSPTHRNLPGGSSPSSLGSDPGAGRHRMTKAFGAQSTADEVLDGVDLRGKRILVTGASAGLGVETARALAARGAFVVGAARDLSKARRATEAVRMAA